MRTSAPKAPLLETFLNSNPIVLLVGVGVGVATVVAGTMTYLTSQKIEDLEIQHKTEIAELNDKNKENLLEITQPLQAKIEDLNFRMSSIERRVPGTGPSYLDVSTISIGPETLKTLNSRYTSYDNDGFLVAVPTGVDWDFQLTNELDFLRTIYSFMDTVVTVVPQFKGIAAARVYLWESKSKMEISTKLDDVSITFTYHPAVAVEHIDQALLKNRTKMLADIENENAAEKNIVSKAGSKLDTQQRNHTNSSSRAMAGTTQQATDKIIGDADNKQEVVDFLEKIGSNDVTNFELFDTFNQLLTQNATIPLHNRIISVQKKGNVFYIQEQIIFRNIDVAINDGEHKHLGDVSVDEEIFFISRGEDGYLIKVFLPPVPDRADNFTWSKSWLTGLQVPIDDMER